MALIENGEGHGIDPYEKDLEFYHLPDIINFHLKYVFIDILHETVQCA